MGDTLSAVTSMIFGSTEEPSVSSQSSLLNSQTELLSTLAQFLKGQVGTGTGVNSSMLSSLLDNQGGLTQSLSGLLGTGGTTGAAATSLLPQLLTQLGGLDSDALTGASGGSLKASADMRSKLLDNLSGYSPRDMYSTGEAAINRLIQPFDPTESKNYWQKSIVDPAMAQWENEILPMISEKYSGLNAGSSGAFNRAVTKSGTDLATDLGAQLSDVVFKDYSAQQDRASTLASMAATLGSSGMTNLSDMLNSMVSSGVSTSDAAGKVASNIGDVIGNLTSGASSSSNSATALLSALLGISEAEAGQLTNQLPANNAWLKNYLAQVLGVDPTDTVVQEGYSSPGLLGSFMEGFGASLGKF